jgi:dihydrodipicolinate synthase/N-acetylneuraminate lyase
MSHTTPAGYEQKFENFINMCATAKTKGATEVIVAAPWVIGDTYDEVIESLSRLADAGLALHIAKR